MASCPSFDVAALARSPRLGQISLKTFLVCSGSGASAVQNGRIVIGLIGGGTDRDRKSWCWNASKVAWRDDAVDKGRTGNSKDDDNSLSSELVVVSIPYIILVSFYVPCLQFHIRDNTALQVCLLEKEDDPNISATSEMEEPLNSGPAILGGAQV
jgi:hypothetical protein